MTPNEREQVQVFNNLTPKEKAQIIKTVPTKIIIEELARRTEKTENYIKEMQKLTRGM